ncbi:MAG: response regulator [Chitinophagaceae bacterium]
MADTLNILLAEDDCDDSFLFQEALNRLPYSINLSIAEDGEQLISILEKSVFPDFIFLDLNMPKKDGYECLTYIRKEKNDYRAKVIILSTSSNAESVNFAYEKGADLYVKKPDNFNALVRSLEFCLQYKKYPEKPTREEFLLLV